MFKSCLLRFWPASALELAVSRGQPPSGIGAGTPAYPHLLLSATNISTAPAIDHVAWQIKETKHHVKRTTASQVPQTMTWVKHGSRLTSNSLHELSVDQKSVCILLVTSLHKGRKLSQVSVVQTRLRQAYCTPQIDLVPVDTLGCLTHWPQQCR